MTIEVEIQGTNQIAEFPDGTSPEVIRQTLAQQAQQPETFQERPVLEKIRGVGEAVTGAVTGALAEPISGIAGLGEAARAAIVGEEDPFRAGAEQVARTREALTFEPGEAGRQFTEEAIAGTLEFAKEKFGNATLEQALELGLQGASDVESIVLERFGPEAATVLKTLPIAAIETIPVLFAGRAARAIPTEIFTQQSATKQRIGRLLEEGAADVETARFKLADSITEGAPRVIADPLATETIKQGFDEGVIAAVKGASSTDKTKMLEMVDIMERGKKNKRFALTNRPSDIAGNSLLDRFRVVVDANKQAGKELEGVAKSLKGQRIDSTPAVATFVDDLDSIGVTLARAPNGQVRPNFKGSDIEDLAGPEAAINRIVKRLAGTKPPDAFELHRMKRFIDEQVTFGKSAEGLTGRTESILKNLRRNLDGILDSNFPEYDRVNSTFSETIGAIDALQDVSGKKLNLIGPNADKATGTLLRRLMSNAQSRVNLLDSVEQIERVARNQGGIFDDDLLTQVLFVDELDSVFGPVARTSFQGQIQQAITDIPTTARGAVLKAAEKGFERARGINEAGAFKSIKDLLAE